LYNNIVVKFCDLSTLMRENFERGWLRRYEPADEELDAGKGVLGDILKEKMKGW